jgi:hypothetical protein
MPKLESNTLDDTPAIETCEGFAGVDSFTRASLLPPEIMAVMQNAITKDNGEPQTRYGFGALSDAAFAAAKVQGLGWFDAYTGAAAVKYLVACANGATYKWDGAAKTAVASYAPADAAALVQFAMGINKLYVVDGSSDLYAFDGTTFARVISADPATSPASGAPPKGASIALYHTGMQRLILTGVASFPDAVWISDVAKADVGNWDWNNWLFRVGNGEGDPIVAVAELPGDFTVFFKRNSVVVYYTPALAQSASLWTRSFRTVGAGLVGKRAFAQCGNDIYFFTREGIRQLSRMDGRERDFQVEPPMSLPVQTYINRINWTYGSKIWMHKYRNFLVVGVPLDAATEPDYVMVFNLRFGKWCGVWKSLTATCALSTWFSDQERLILGDNSGYVKEWKDYKDEGLTATFQDTSPAAVEIETRFRTKSFVHGEPESPKDGEFYWAEFAPECQGLAHVDIYNDETLERSDTHNLQQVQNQLPVNLPFDLAVLKPSQKADSLIGLENFREQYFEIWSAAGKLALKRFVTGAFINPLFTDNG